MRVINELAIDNAAKALITCAREATDASGLRIVWEIDPSKARSLVIGALVGSLDAPDTVRTDRQVEVSVFDEESA